MPWWGGDTEIRGMRPYGEIAERNHHQKPSFAVKDRQTANLTSLHQSGSFADILILEAIEDI